MPRIAPYSELRTDPVYMELHRNAVKAHYYRNREAVAEKNRAYYYIRAGRPVPPPKIKIVL